ncbi:ubinuclein-2-like [Bidens hawaiensis]|uniref:ubinuclein-2-like n=1 Tax=Bidens hawaiensis TaxID=980011 RepID=UPI004049F0D9
MKKMSQEATVLTSFLRKRRMIKIIDQKSRQLYQKPQKNTKIGHARVRSVRLTSEQHSVNNGRIELPDLNMPYTMQAENILPTYIKDESYNMVNDSTLESTMLELETMAADSRRLHGDVEDAVRTKSKLPRELKKKLETVARLAHSRHGRIPDELNMHLLSILGHWLKPRTLKRWLRDMVPSEISACGGDAIAFGQIEKEIIEMIKLRNPIKDGSDNEAMELHATSNANYTMDHEMEDKICDFYDIHVQGMDEIKSSEIRKFYIQLAALWPNGTMDNHGVRNAICSSKERRRTALQDKDREKGKRKTLTTAWLDDDLHGKAKLVAAVVNDTNAPLLTFPDTSVPGTPELNQKLSAPAKRFSPPSAGSCQYLFDHNQ